MKSKYLIDPTTFELPAFDAQITQYVEEKGEEGEAFERKRENLGLATKAALGRMLIRQGLGLAD